MSDTMREMMRAMDALEQEMVPPDLRAKGWVYRDVPSRFSPEMWREFLSVLGKENEDYILVCYSSGPDWYRGQFFLSPQAIENCKRHGTGKEADDAVE